MDLKRYYEKYPHLKPDTKDNDNDGNNNDMQYPPGYLESLLQNDMNNIAHGQ